MEHLKVKWNHSFPDEPVWLYSEIDSGRWEVRKVEIFRDGRLSFASKSDTSGSTRLGEEPIPELALIGEDPQFEPVAIERSEFEAIWHEAIRSKA